MKVRTHLPALTIAPLAAALISVAMADGSMIGFLRRAADLNAVLLGIAELGVYVALIFGALHGLARRFETASRPLYTWFGSAALVLGAALRPHVDIAGATDGMAPTTFAVLVAILIGAVMGYAYHVNASYEAEDDDPERLIEAIQGRVTLTKLHGRRLHRRGDRPFPDPAHLDTGYVETADVGYFAGPTRVRTRIGTACVAALVAVIANGLPMIVIHGIGILRAVQDDPKRSALEDYGWVDSIADVPELALILAGYGAGTIVPVLLFVPLLVMVVSTHLVLRALKRSSYASYVVGGAAAPVAFTFVVMPIFFVAGFSMAFASAVAMAFYRRYAGLEPVPVSEDIYSTDRRHLIGANHPRRRYGRVISS